MTWRGASERADEACKLREGAATGLGGLCCCRGCRARACRSTLVAHPALPDRIAATLAGMNAKNHWHGKQLLNSTLDVSVAPALPLPLPPPPMVPAMPMMPAVPLPAPPPGEPPASAANAGELDDNDEGGGLKLNHQVRRAAARRLWVAVADKHGICARARASSCEPRRPESCPPHSPAAAPDFPPLQARQALMNRLAGSAGMPLPQVPLPAPPPGPPPVSAADAALALEQVRTCRDAGTVRGPPCTPLATPSLPLGSLPCLCGGQVGFRTPVWVMGGRRAGRQADVCPGEGLLPCPMSVRACARARLPGGHPDACRVR